MAQDPDHHHYPIAFGVADGEKEESWMWFMNELKEVISPGMVEDKDPEFRKLVFTSDINLSLMKSIRVVYPLAKHGYCIYHLSQNVKTKVGSKKGKTIVKQFLNCAEAYTEIEFLTLYSVFKRRYPAADEYIQKSANPKKWARCYFSGERYNILTTNSVESVNGVFCEARKYMLLPMIDMIIAKMGEWFNNQRKASAEIPDSQKLVHVVNNILEESIPIGKKLLSQELNNQTHEYNVIGLDRKSYVVNLSKQTCTCKYFDIDRYPCVHAIQGIIRLSGEKEVRHYEFASHHYLVLEWRLGYRRTIYPVPHMTTWLIPKEEPIHFGFPPPHEIKKGMPQQARYPSPGEYRGRGRGIMHNYLAGENNA